MELLSKKLLAAWVAVAVTGACIGIYVLRNTNAQIQLEEGAGRYSKQFMLEEMFKQWKEMLQDPTGEIPIMAGYKSWQVAGKMMQQQKKRL